MFLHCVSKTSHLWLAIILILDTHDPIAIIFGTSVTEKVRNQTCFVFPPHLSSASALPCEVGNPKDSTLVHCAGNTVSPTSAVHSTLFILSHAPNSPELNALITRFWESYTAAWVWVVSEKDWKTKQLVEFMQCTNNALIRDLNEKCNFRVSLFCQVVQKHKLFEVACKASFDCLLYR